MFNISLIAQQRLEVLCLQEVQEMHHLQYWHERRYRRHRISRQLRQYLLLIQQLISRQIVNHDTPTSNNSHSSSLSRFTNRIHCLSSPVAKFLKLEHTKRAIPNNRFRASNHLNQSSYNAADKHHPITSLLNPTDLGPISSPIQPEPMPEVSSAWPDWASSANLLPVT